MKRPVPGLTIEQQPEAVLLRMAVWAEARGEPIVGQLAVAWVIVNRARSRGTSESAEILKPLQFSSFNPLDPNRAMMLTAHLRQEVSWAVADAVCEMLESGHTIDPTSGADHYYAHKQVQPSWGRGNPRWIETAVIGAHVFGRTT